MAYYDVLIDVKDSRANQKDGRNRINDKGITSIIRKQSVMNAIPLKPTDVLNDVNISLLLPSWA
jgi:hypothetical protein